MTVKYNDRAKQQKNAAYGKNLCFYFKDINEVFIFVTIKASSWLLALSVRSICLQIKEERKKKPNMVGEKKTQVKFHTIDKAYNPEKSAMWAKAWQYSIQAHRGEMLVYSTGPMSRDTVFIILSLCSTAERLSGQWQGTGSHLNDIWVHPTREMLEH